MAAIIVLYHSDSGNTSHLAELVAEGARHLEQADVTMIDAAAGPIDLDAAAAADALAIGSPEYLGYVAGSVKTFFDRICYDARFKGKPYIAFGTHGGGATVCETVDRLAAAVGLERVGEGFMTMGAVAPTQEASARDVGANLARSLRR